MQVNVVNTNNIIQEVNSPNILVINDNEHNQVIVTQPLTNVIKVATPGPQGAIGPTGSSLPFTKISGSDSWFTTSSIQLTGSLNITNNNLNFKGLPTSSIGLTTGSLWISGSDGNGSKYLMIFNP